MKIKIGGLEISDVSMDELDELVRRYGGAIAEGGTQAPAVEQHRNGVGSNLPLGATADIVVLKKLVESGSTGTIVTTIGDILGRRGKATRAAVKQWAKRIGLTDDENMEPFEECRIGTQRGLRIKPSLLDVAKLLLESREGRR